MQAKKHRTKWCAAASKYRCTRCGRSRIKMKMREKCEDPRRLVKDSKHKLKRWGKARLGGHDMLRRVDHMERPSCGAESVRATHVAAWSQSWWTDTRQKSWTQKNMEDFFEKSLQTRRRKGARQKRERMDSWRWKRKSYQGRVQEDEGVIWSGRFHGAHMIVEPFQEGCWGTEERRSKKWVT